MGNKEWKKYIAIIIKNITLKRITIFIISIVILFLLKSAFVANGVYKMEDAFKNNIALQNVNNVSQILASIFVMLGVVIALWQYNLTTKSEISRYTNDCVLKAVELSGYYKDNILDKYGILFYVFDKCKMTDIICKVKISNMNNFDLFELEDNFDTREIEQLKEIIKSDSFAQIVVEAMRRFDFPINNNTFIKEPILVEGKTKIVVKVKKNDITSDFLNDIVSEILNNLEFFSMHFTHNAADETVVYQSLHKTYLEIVQVLYYNIAINNKDSQKLYVNVIELFNKWKQLVLDDKSAEVSATREKVKFGSVCNPVK